MIVDDDAEMRALLRDALEHEGFHVREHDTADGLMPLVAAWAPRVVVLLRHMRQRHPETPVVLVTAFGGAEVEAEARRLGAAYYLDKPFRVTRLLEVLHTMVGPLEAKARPVGIANVDRD